MNHLMKAFILCICVASIYSASVDKDTNELNDLQNKFKNERINSRNETEGNMFTGMLNALVKMIKLERAEKQPIVNVIASNENSTNSKRDRRQAYGGYGGGAPAPGGYGRPGGFPAGPGGFPGGPGGFPGGPGGFPGGPGGYGAPAPGGYGQPFPDFGYDYFMPNDFLYDYYDWVCTEDDCQLCNILTSECCNPTVTVNCVLPDTCFNNPCLSGGTCITSQTHLGNPDFVCACLPGFTGKYCQLTNDYLFPLPPPPPPPAPVYPRPAYPAPAYQPPQQQYQAPAPAYQPPQQQYQAPAPAPSYGGGYQKPGPVGPAPPQRSALPPPPPPQNFGGPQPLARPLSAKATNFDGFACDCEGRGRCAEVATETGNEYFCICDNGKYGSTCLEDFYNPCERKENLQARYAPADARLPRNYFIECKIGLPYLRKCDETKRWSPKLEKCISIRRPQN